MLSFSYRSYFIASFFVEGACNVQQPGSTVVIAASEDYLVDDGDSDEEELSVLAREDLIRDTLSNTGRPASFY